jgi:uncharacterized membrane protein
MPLESLALLLVAAFLNAAANVFLKQARDKLAFAWWMLAVTSVLGLPMWYFTADIPPVGWAFIVASGLLETVYFCALSRAYSLGDLSLVYPIARGSAPLFIVVWAGLFLAERPSSLGLAGIVSIALGLYLINLTSIDGWRRPLAESTRPAVRWALATGILISAYATVDKAGIRHVDPLKYLYLILCVAWVALAPQWLSARRRQALLAEIKSNPGQLTFARGVRVGAAALSGMTAYALVLVALRQSHVGYVGAVREVSVVIGAWIGVQFMKEQGGELRVFASVLVVIGILLIAANGASGS